eukprot:TRINITY_DN4642_c0_g3_i1.p1 TRINITY_DN4642_c0_g3~~TRINITY_DN4642_c0_g3_i1.p1  ORF type:complete len:335 (-),score=82.36 TRINITY_DN4642_c0_g3_i1:240-1244(-)
MALIGFHCDKMRNTETIKLGIGKNYTMEKSPTCEKHKNILDIYCETCKEFICSMCLEEHAEKGCKFPMHISAYVKKQLLPRYEAALKNLEEKKGTLEEFTKNFKASSERIAETLVSLKSQLDSLSKAVDDSIAALSFPIVSLASGYNALKAKIEAGKEDLIKAIEEKRIELLVKHIKEQSIVNIVEAGDGEYRLIEALERDLQSLLNLRELEILPDTLRHFQSLYGGFADQERIGTSGKYVYGICKKISNGKILCRYDIQRKKLEESIKVYENCTATQIRGRIFLSGGSDPPTNTVNEFVESTLKVVPKAPMANAKYNYVTEIVSGMEFVAVGG